MIKIIHSYAPPILPVKLVSLTGCVSNPTVTDNNASVKVAGPISVTKYPNPQQKKLMLQNRRLGKN